MRSTSSPQDRTTSASPELLLRVDRGSRQPARQQVEDGIRAAVRAGRLAAGTRLPSTRALAGDLGVARGVVVEAYGQLAAEGYLLPRRGAGTVVASVCARADAEAAARTVTRPEPARPAAPRLRYDFRPGIPDLSLFPRSTWLRATRAGLARLPDAALSYGDPRGLPALRVALADYLGRVRGVVADPDRIVLTSGFAQALSLVVRVLAAAGSRRIAVEDPGGPASGRWWRTPVGSRSGSRSTPKGSWWTGCRPASGRCSSPRRTSSRPGWCCRPPAGPPCSSGPTATTRT